MKCIKYLMMLSFWLYLQPALALTTVLPNSPAFLYTGRIDFTQAERPFISWPGSSIKANISGDTLILIMDDDEGKNYFNVIVNGRDQHPAVISLEKGEHQYDLSYLLSELQPTATHQVEIFKRTEGHEGGTRFLGLKLSDNAKLQAAPKPLQRKIAYFGDSITSGMGNEGADNGDDKLSAEKNHYLSYAAMTARNLGAEFHSISLSGIGFMVSWFDYAMPTYFDQVSAVGDNNTLWDFNRWKPDVVVVNLGQNDFWITEDKNKLQQKPSDKDIVNAYKSFLMSLRGKYPKANFISVIGSMDLARNDHVRWAGHLKMAVKELNQNEAFINQPINFIQFDYNGYDAHPRVAQHWSNAEKLTKTIRELMGW
ncbi:GDSL-type esterase/lipase family protein [Shewanella acanthi]|uniref:GDSL-type esterase/lipase family protein n=1 Tax=Shewanella acanthi TaxID=2864212 RepID=UPI001C65965A|nr:GDSL-type esterase/lipase family protein [Shewanella acanthi]QYJ78336.1 electron transporter RnfD [Shewanella acanthi]